MRTRFRPTIPSGGGFSKKRDDNPLVSMGGGFSKHQAEHLQELRELTKVSIIILKNNGKLPTLSKKDLIRLLKYIWQHCPAYPEKGSLKTAMWRRLGTYFHKSPRAPGKILAAWWVVMECLMIHEKGLAEAAIVPALPPP